MDSRIKLLPRYLKTFGLFSGLRVFVAAELGGRRVTVPAINFPLTLRRATTDILVFREIFLHGTYDVDLHEPRVIVDAGANVGLASVFFANRFEGATIYAIEPDTSSFQQLLVNKGRYDQIVPIHSALWNQDTFVRLKDPAASSWAVEVEKASPGSATIKALSIQSLMNMHRIEKIDLLKLDIEGSEKEIFEGEVAWLQKTHHILVETHDWLRPGASRSVMKCMSNHDFSLRVVNGMLLFTNNRFG